LSFYQFEISTMPFSTLQRMPFKGSCHCGHVRYIVYIILPKTNVASQSSPTSFPMLGSGETKAYEAFTEATKQTVFRCNCTTCHKMGSVLFLPACAYDDFLLLSPPMSEEGIAEGVTNYRRVDSTNHPQTPGGFSFCNNCGVRCFAMSCGWERKKAVLEGSEEEVEVSVPKKHPHQMGGGLGVNLLTIDAWQKEFDLRKWQENGWIRYYGFLDEDDSKYSHRSDRIRGRPFEGGLW